MSSFPSILLHSKHAQRDSVRRRFRQLLTHRHHRRYLADKYRRDRLVWVGGVLAFVYLALQVYAVHHATKASVPCFVILCVVLGLQGISNGILGGPVMALLDDSVVLMKGHRLRP